MPILVCYPAIQLSQSFYWFLKEFQFRFNSENQRNLP